MSWEAYLAAGYKDCFEFSYNAYKRAADKYDDYVDRHNLLSHNLYLLSRQEEDPLRTEP